MSRYDKLFFEYVRELKKAREEVTTWWDSLFEVQMEGSGNYKLAESIIRPRWPCGPVSHPRIIAIYRKYFLLIDEMNSALLLKWSEEDATKDKADSENWGVEDEADEEEGIVEPRFVLLERLEEENSELGEFMSMLVFSPVGINDQGDVV